ncbi:type A chloramphenicol O-acetyltransferase [Lysinibacillus pakistanensis]|uniref:Type A chloramphenicol O-acetyltransferase n=1 Tax=Lysinibacillus pakistanensis TaxID=759811 RepID=A0ABX6DAX9_9BACI|nr:type A chloramphenicol O-acetyltransferase [Lysinibacillus pakistanensis]
MIFNKIDRKNWQRHEYFEHYMTQQTTFSMTSEIDISIFYKNIKDHNFKFYPAFIYLVTKAINSNIAFRTCFNSQGELGYWEKLNPSYTIFNEETKTFSSIWTETSDNFSQFHQDYESDVTNYNGRLRLFPKSPIPENIFHISMIPWCSFTGFNLNIHNENKYLLPIITAGKFVRKENAICLPVSLQMHHAVCDGYHASLFMNYLQSFADESYGWLNMTH